MSIFPSFFDFDFGGVEWKWIGEGMRQREILAESETRLRSGLHSDGWSSRRLSRIDSVVASEPVAKEKGLDNVKGAQKNVAESFLA